jgi:transposase
MWPYEDGSPRKPQPIRHLPGQIRRPERLRAAGQSNVLRWAAQPQPQRPGCPHRRHLHRVRRADRDRHRNRSRRTRHPRVAAQIKELKHQRTIVAAEVEKLLDDFPLSTVLMSMPGVGIKTAATVLLTIGDTSSFRTSGHLAAYAGIAPVTRRSGTFLRGEFPARSGNKQLKNAAWIPSCHDPASKAYSDRQRTQGTKHNAAVICLARRRCDVIFAMLKNGTLYQEKTPQAA